MSSRNILKRADLIQTLRWAVEGGGFEDAAQTELAARSALHHLELQHPDDIAIVRSAWELWWKELEGPIHGQIQTIRGMCSDECPHAEIDTALAALNEAVYKLRCAIQYPPGRVTEADLERARQLAKEHGW